MYGIEAGGIGIVELVVFEMDWMVPRFFRVRDGGIKLIGRFILPRAANLPDDRLHLGSMVLTTIQKK